LKVVKVIDFHTHCFPDKIAPGAIDVLGKSADLKPFYDGTVTGLRESMGKNGVDRSVVLNIATNPNQVSNVNNFAIEKNSEDVIMFGSIHPDFKEYKSEISRLKSAGIKGIKLHPEYQGFYIDDKAMYGIYECVFENNMILIFHTGVDLGFEPPVHATPERSGRVLDDFRDGKMVFAHCGGFSMWNDVERFLVGRDVYFDISFAVDRMNREQFINMIKNHGADKILFASDLPWASPSECIEIMKGLDLTQEEKENIFHRNAKRLLNLTFNT